MDLLTLYGLVAVVLMLVFYSIEDRSPWFVLAFAIACAMASIYGFLQGAWPFGVVEIIWSIIALHRWRLRLKESGEIEKLLRNSAIAPLGGTVGVPLVNILDYQSQG